MTYPSFDEHSVGAPMIAGALAIMEEFNQRKRLGYSMRELVRVQYLHMGSMHFTEFLLATGEDRLAELILNYQYGDSVTAIAHKRLLAVQLQGWTSAGSSLRGYDHAGRDTLH